ncbi:formyltransferase family protein [Thalassobaculum sp.]|uniref:formyltransferase family protein n=1 Tax=Thalassobaculum sp. TaxID=2022740 RepID=UPI003B5A3A89
MWREHGDVLTAPTVARLVASSAKPKSNVLFLGYDKTKTRLIDALSANKCKIWHTEDRMQCFDSFDIVVSFGYRYIIPEELIRNTKAPIINLHTGYLPWNRGAHPNFWAFYDGTPSGVSIHLIDKGIDTGPVLYQRRVQFTKDETTFKATYNRLISEVEDLFLENIIEFIEQRFTATPQRGPGSFKRVRDLPVDFSGWNAEIEAEIRRLRSKEPLA